MEGDAGANRLNPTEQADTEVTANAFPETSAEEVSEAGVAPSTQPAPRGPSRLRRRGVIGVCAVLVLLAAGAATGGYLALRSHHQSEAVSRDDAAAIAAAKDCVAATQAADLAALPAAQQKIAECSTGNLGAQAAVYSDILMRGYLAADVHVQISDMRTAVERNNDDGSIDLLMALRVKVDNAEAQGQEFGYRLRVKMEREDGQYKVARLDQVAK
jgi:Mce-associated membrane protein